MSNVNKLNRVNLAAAFSLAVISFLILIPIVYTIRVPLESKDSGIVSLANVTNLSPYTNYVSYLVLLLIPTVVAIAALNAKQKLIDGYWRTFTKTTSQIWRLFSHTKVYYCLIFILVFTWVINKNYRNLDWTLIDAFHEGEYLGFLPNFLTLEKPFLSSFMVHGFGLDVWTSLIANRLSDGFNTIALTRFWRITQGAIGYLGCYWIIGEIVGSVKVNANKLSLFLISSICFTVLDGFWIDYFVDIFAGRDTLFILQLALTIRFLRLVTTNKLSQAENLLLPIAIGASIPVSILYVYDRAAYFIFVYLFTCGLSLSFGRRFWLNFISKSSLGIVAASIPIVIWLGFDQIKEIFTQVFFWVRYARYISFNSLPSWGFNFFTPWFRLTIATLVQVFSILYLVTIYRQGVRLGALIRGKSLFIVLLFASLVYMRISLDRPNNAAYIGSAAVISAFLLIYLLLELYQVYFDRQVSQLANVPANKWLITGFVVAAIALHPILNPLLSLDKIGRIYYSYQVPDREIVNADFLQAYDEIKPEVEPMSCFFTLNQQGLWYYLFNKPSCSKFSIVFYARTTAAQKTLIQEVDAQKPNIILFSSRFTNNVEGIPISDGIPIIYQYFLNHYQPYKLIESHWFWRRNTQQPTFTLAPATASYGNISSPLQEKLIKGKPVILRGTATLPQQNKIADAVYLSYGVNNQLIEVAQVNETANWTIPVPTISLPAGKNIFRVWSYDANSNQLTQIGKDINIELVTQLPS